GGQRIATGRDEVESVVEVLARQVAIRLRAAHLVEEGVAGDRRGPAGAPAGPRVSPGSRAGSDSSTSKRLAGAMMARLGSSSRWLARPILCIRRLTPLGGPIWFTRPTSP